LDQTSIVNFSVFASNDIFIQLSNGDPTASRYEILFGGWGGKKSVISSYAGSRHKKDVARIEHGKDKFIEVLKGCT